MDKPKRWVKNFNSNVTQPLGFVCTIVPDYNYILETQAIINSIPSEHVSDLCS